MARKRKTKTKPMYSNGQGVTCTWCRRTCTNTADKGPLGATRDHIAPRAHGPSDMPRTWSCRTCNQAKDSMTPGQWISFRRWYPNYVQIAETEGQGKITRLREGFLDQHEASLNAIFLAKSRESGENAT